MIKHKQGAALALNVIIIAVIGLLVLVVVIFIFGGKINVFSKGVSDCISLGGSCEKVSCFNLKTPRPSIPSGECLVGENEPKEYCCSTAIG